MDDNQLQTLVNITILKDAGRAALLAFLARHGRWPDSLVCIVVSKSIHCLSNFATGPTSVGEARWRPRELTGFSDGVILDYLVCSLLFVLCFANRVPLSHVSKHSSLT